MQQHIRGNRFFGERIIGAAEMQNFFSPTGFLDKLHPLNEFDFFAH
jgi:hypothetical protein